jgi:hypothetical protein
MAHRAVGAVESLSLFDTGLQIVRRRWNPAPAILVDQDAFSLGREKSLNLAGLLKCAEVELRKREDHDKARQHYNKDRCQDPALHSVVRPEGPM